MTDQTAAPASEEAGEQDAAALWAEFDAEEAASATPEEQTADDDHDAAEEAADDDGSDEDEAPEDDGEPIGDPEDDGEDEGDDAHATLTPDDRLQHQIRSDRGRISAMQREIAALRARLEGTGSGTPDPQGQPDAARKEQEDFRGRLKSLAEDYPEIAEPISAAMEMLDARIQQVQQAEQSRQEAALQAERARFDELVPAGADYVAARYEQFVQWVEDQPRAIRQAFAQNREVLVDADAAAMVVTRFQEAMGDRVPASPAPGREPKPNPLAEKRKRQLAAAASPKGRSGVTTSPEPPPDAPDSAWWDYWERKGA